jgi:hypothetical protein
MTGPLPKKRKGEAPNVAPHLVRLAFRRFPGPMLFRLRPAHAGLTQGVRCGRMGPPVHQPLQPAVQPATELSIGTPLQRYVTVTLHFPAGVEIELVAFHGSLTCLSSVTLWSTPRFAAAHVPATTSQLHQCFRFYPFYTQDTRRMFRFASPHFGRTLRRNKTLGKVATDPLDVSTLCHSLRSLCHHSA